MGVTGLLPRLGDIVETVNSWQVLPGRSVAVDSFGWLHALAVHRAADLTGEKPRYDRVAKAFVARALRFQARGIDAIYVFDGAVVPAKKETAEKRMEARATKRQMAEAVQVECARAPRHGPAGLQSVRL